MVNHGQFPWSLHVLTSGNFLLDLILWHASTESNFTESTELETAPQDGSWIQDGSSNLV